MDERPKLISPPQLIADDVEQVPPEWRAGGAEWRKASAALYGRLRGMIVDVMVTLKKDYPDTYGDYTPRPSALIAWTARQIADVYKTPPALDYGNVESGSPFAGEVVTAIETYRASAGVDAAMLSGHEEAVTSGNGILLWQPTLQDLEGGGTALSVHVIVVQAHNCAWELTHHPQSTDERHVEKFWVRLPVPGETMGSLQSTALAVITKTTARWYDGPLAGQPLWPRNGKAQASAVMASDEECAKPFGQVPICVIRWCDPIPGDFLALTRADLLYQARALDAGFTAMGETDKEQGFGQWVGKKIGGTGVVKFGRRELIDLPDEKSDLKNVAPQPNQAGSLASLEAFMRTSVATQDLNPASLLRSTAVTAEGKKLEIADRDNLRARHLPQLARVEQRNYDLMRIGLNKLRGAQVLPKAKVTATYQPPTMPGNDLQEVQSDERLLAMGQENPYSLYMQRKKVSSKTAKERVDENLKITRELLGGLPTDGSSLKVGAAATKPPDPGAKEKPVATTAPTDDVQKQSLNGAQVDSMVNMFIAGAEGKLPLGTVRAAMRIAYPNAEPADVDEALRHLGNFTPRVEPPPPGSPAPAEPQHPEPPTDAPPENTT